MKRRKVIKYGALCSASSFINLNLIHPLKKSNSLSKAMLMKQSYDWILLYWMPYDNNLSRFGESIIQMISRGVQSNNILVVVESDFSGTAQLSRSIITKGKIDVQYLETADSSSEEVFTEYLNWAKSQFQAEHWAIVFLGHGGRLVEISPDEHPNYGSFSENRWMNVQKLSNILVNFKRAVDDRLDLIFFQNCNKGNIEVLYTFRDAAKYTLSSQLRLGAPNYYYESLLHYLGHHPQINGGKLGEKIMEFEQRDMYHSLTVTNNRYFQKLPEKINPVIDAILASDLEAVITFVNSELNSNRHHVSNRRYEFYSYYGEKFVDLVDFFQKINTISGSPVNKYKELVDFLKNSLIQKVHQNGELLSSITRPKYQNYSGIGLFLPTSRQHLEAYRYLPVYSDLRLVSLFKAILFT